MSKVSRVRVAEILRVVQLRLAVFLEQLSTSSQVVIFSQGEGGGDFQGDGVDLYDDVITTPSSNEVTQQPASDTRQVQVISRFI